MEETNQKQVIVRELDLSEMEQIEGGMDCGSGWGLTAAFAITGLLVVATGGGALLAMGVIAGTYGSGMLAGYNCFG